MRTLSACKAFVSLFAFTQALSGCDIVQGFQSTGDTLFPVEATHLSTPGVRILPDGYRQLRFAAVRELYMMGRLPDEDPSALYSMRFADPKPCSIPNVQEYWPSQQRTRSPGPIAYREEGREGTLRFADTTCNSYAIEIENANAPAFELPRGFVVVADRKLLIVDPQAKDNAIQLVSDEVTQIYFNAAFGNRRVVRYQGTKLKVFNQDLTDQEVFGENVQGFRRVGQQLYVEDLRTEDDDAVRVITRLAVASGKVEETVIDTDACAIGVPSDGLITYRKPCEGGSQLYAYSERLKESFPLDVDADPRNLRLRAAQGSPGNDPRKDAFWYFYLRGNALIVRTPQGDEHTLGVNAWLDSAELVETASSAHGYALVDIEGELGTLIWWSPDGTTRELARNVLATGQGLLADSDGVVGNWIAISGDRVVVVAERVRRDGFRFQDAAGRWTAVLRDFDGPSFTGEFAVFDGTVDALFATPPDQPLIAPKLEPFSDRVPALAAWPLNDLLPGFVWFSDYDFETSTGTLLYRNLDLRFTALLNYGVSDFVFSNDEVIYSIPHGESKGVWVALGK